MNKLPTISKVNELYDYDPSTGLFTKKNGVIIHAKSKDGYIRISVCGCQYYSHRIAWMMINSDPENMQIDHINHDRADNRIINLRAVTNLENSKNRAPTKRSNTGFNGVSWITGKNKFKSRVVVNNKEIHLGYSLTLIDAVILRIKANIKYGFHNNHGML